MSVTIAALVASLIQSGSCTAPSIPAVPSQVTDVAAETAVYVDFIRNSSMYILCLNDVADAPGATESDIEAAYTDIDQHMAARKAYAAAIEPLLF